MHYLVLILEWLFFVGLGGSLIVALMAFFGDLEVFIEKE